MASQIAHALEHFFFLPPALRLGLRLAARLLLVLLVLRRGNSAPGFSTFDCIGYACQPEPDDLRDIARSRSFKLKAGS
jgi:hypothetical protein